MVWAQVSHGSAVITESLIIAVGVVVFVLASGPVRVSTIVGAMAPLVLSPWSGVGGGSDG